MNKRTGQWIKFCFLPTVLTLGVEKSWGSQFWTWRCLCTDLLPCIFSRNWFVWICSAGFITRHSSPSCCLYLLRLSLSFLHHTACAMVKVPLFWWGIQRMRSAISSSYEIMVDSQFAFNEVPGWNASERFSRHILISCHLVLYDIILSTCIGIGYVGKTSFLIYTRWTDGHLNG